MTPGQAQAAVAEAVRRLAAEFSPLAIYHFGSSVPGASVAPNDIDLLVIVETASEGYFERGARAYRTLHGLGVPVDVQVYTRAEFEGRAQRRVSFERAVASAGRVVYAA
ncbi:MAG: nucleotidyltransferase domain-containing protein [Chloroflexi bacterium]|nr:nucleotidyltransferase domain-containing protein [Chloroflexota bacterium]